MEEYLTLTDLEKIDSVKSHLKSIQRNKFDIDLKIQQEQSISNPDEIYISRMSQEKQNLLDKEQFLINELNALENNLSV